MLRLLLLLMRLLCLTEAGRMVWPRRRQWLLLGLSPKVLGWGHCLAAVVPLLVVVLLL
jgi:hypothetical protein